MALQTGWVVLVGMCLLCDLSVEGKGGRGGGSRSSSSYRSSSSSRSSSYSKPSTSYSSSSSSWGSGSSYKPSSSSSWNKPSSSSFVTSKPVTSPASRGFVTPKPASTGSSSMGFVTPKPGPTGSSSMGFVTPKAGTTGSSSTGFVTPKPATTGSSSMGFVKPNQAGTTSSTSPGFVSPTGAVRQPPPYNPAFNPSAPINPTLNKPYQVQPQTTINNNYYTNSGAQSIHPPIYQPPIIQNVVHKTKYKSPIIPIIVPFSGTRSFHSTGHYHRHYGWDDSSEERFGGGVNVQYNNVHHHYHLPGENRLIKTQNSLKTSSEGTKYNVTLFQHRNFEGNKLDVSFSIGECVDFPRKFNDDVSSVDTHSNCVMLCEDKKCTGECKQFGQNSINSGKWVGDKLNDKASSMIICNPIRENLEIDDGARAYAQANVTVENGSIIFAQGSDEKQIVTLYTKKGHKGDAFQLSVGPNQCVDVPTIFNDETSSVNVHEKCFILCENYGCSGDCYGYNSTSSFLLDVGVQRDNKISSAKLC